MKTIALAASIILAISLPATAQPKDRVSSGGLSAPSAVGGPQVVLYRVSGVRDNAAAADTGVATSFHCTNYATTTETLRIRLFSQNGSLIADSTNSIASKLTLTFSTHATTGFNEDVYLSPGVLIDQGHAVILGTNVAIGCSALMVDAANITNGTELHLTRYNPIPGTQE